MKILHVLHGYLPEHQGGTERTVAALAGAMAAAGHEVAVVCGSLAVGSTDAVDSYQHDGLRVLRVHRDDLYFESWNKSYHPGVSRTLARLFAAERPDVVHVHHWLRLTADIARLAREAGARVVITAHDYYPMLARVVRRAGDDTVGAPEPLAWMSELEAAEEFGLHRRDFADELRAAHLRLAPSRAHADGLQACAVEDLGPIEVAAPPLLAIPERLRRAPEPGGRRLVAWGSIYPDKGLEVVLDAMRAAGGGWRLQVLGAAHDPAYEAEVRNFAAGLEVSFDGPFGTADLAGVEADYAVLPSLCAESYGLVMDEARALGLPVIASDLPAYREHCEPASCAFVAPGDTAEWTMVLLDPDRLAALQRPAPPALATPALAAADLLARYQAAGGGGWERDPALERDRAGMLFRRAERRLHGVLANDPPARPPDDFLA